VPLNKNEMISGV